MDRKGSELPDTDWTEEELKALSAALSVGTPYLLRLGRACAYALAAYLFLWLQPHFTFSYLALAAGVFFLATVRRTTWIAEVVLACVVVAALVPAGLFREVAGLF